MDEDEAADSDRNHQRRTARRKPDRRNADQRQDDEAAEAAVCRLAHGPRSWERSKGGCESKRGEGKTGIGGGGVGVVITLTAMDERALAERLIGYDTSQEEELAAAASFIKGWLGSHDVDVVESHHNGLPVLIADVGAGPQAVDAPTIIFHGHVDVVPAHSEQFQPRIEGDRLIGRGAYDMKGALAAMLCAVVDAAAQDRIRVRFVCVPDEESDDVDDRSLDALIASRRSMATSRSPASRPTCTSAFRPRACWRSASRSAAPPRTARRRGSATTRSSRPTTSFVRSRRCRSAASRRICSTGRRSTWPGSSAATRFNKVPDRCSMDVDIRYLPGQDPGAILAQIRAIADVRIVNARSSALRRSCRAATPTSAHCARRVAGSIDGEPLSVGRDGASDAVSFLEAGIPAVEFGPVGGGHHGPEEWVSICSLGAYRRRSCDFVRELPAWLESGAAARRRARDAAARTAGAGGGLR